MSATDEAIILAGGFGTRLQSVVSDVPKPLAPVRGRPFLAWLLDAMADQGMKRVILATGYLGDQVEAALGASWRGVSLAYSREERPLGTGGAIVKAAGLLNGEAFFVANGDTWLSLDYAEFDHQARRQQVALAIAVAEVPDTSRYGAIRVQDDRVSGFVEKGCSSRGYINAGVYRLERGVLETCPAAANFSFESEVLVPLAERGAVAAYTQTSEFIDIGVPLDYQRAQDVMPSFHHVD